MTADMGPVPLIDMVGYFAGGITMWGMYRRTMIPLRVGAMCGNVGFVMFGFLAGSYPTLILHALLLPLNTWRMIQMIKLVREIKQAASQDNSLAPLIPYMDRQTAKAGTSLFRMGDETDRMILIHAGTVRLEEIDRRCGPGDVLGEIGAFTPDNRRTCSAVCETDCVLHVMSHDALVQLYYQNPRFGMFLVRIIVRRLLENWQAADLRAKALLT